MGVASLVLGIIGLVLSFVPFIGLFGLVLAIIGLILGIIDWVQKKKKDEKHGQAVAGVVCSALAILFIIFYTILFGALIVSVAENVDEEKVQEFVDSIKNFDEGKIQNYLNSIEEIDENVIFNLNFDFNSSIDA